MPSCATLAGVLSGRPERTDRRNPHTGAPSHCGMSLALAILPLGRTNTSLQLLGGFLTAVLATTCEAKIATEDDAFHITSAATALAFGLILESSVTLSPALTEAASTSANELPGLARLRLLPPSTCAT